MPVLPATMTSSPAMARRAVPPVTTERIAAARNAAESAGTMGSGAAQNTPYEATVTASHGSAQTSEVFAWTVANLALPAPGMKINLDGDSVSLALHAHYNGLGHLIRDHLAHAFFAMAPVRIGIRHKNIKRLYCAALKAGFRRAPHRGAAFANGLASQAGCLPAASVS